MGRIYSCVRKGEAGEAYFTAEAQRLRRVTAEAIRKRGFLSFPLCEISAQRLRLCGENISHLLQRLLNGLRDFAAFGGIATVEPCNDFAVFVHQKLPEIPLHFTAETSFSTG